MTDGQQDPREAHPAGGIPSELLGGLGDFSIPLPNLPMGMTLQSITLNSRGVLVHITGHNIPFGN